MTLHPDFRRIPLAHRGLHGPGTPENSRAAVAAAVAAGYGIEIDVRIAADGAAMVFHDATLDRLTAATGPVADRRGAELCALRLAGTDETIPTLHEVLGRVAGLVPLLVEVKPDAAGADRPGGPLDRAARAVAAALTGYDGPVAVMSFDPGIVAVLAQAAPAVPRGLTTMTWPADAPGAARLNAIADYDRTGASFVSHDAADLAHPRLAGLRARGPVLCWTIRDAASECVARTRSDNITFEGYRPNNPPCAAP